MERHIRTILVILLMLALTVFDLESAGAQTSGAPAGPNPAHSSEKQDYQAFDLGELYVKGDKVPEVYKMTEVTEITPEQFEITHSQTVAEALTYIPGVLVTTGFRNEPTVRIHGFVQNKTLVLIDGVPYYDTARGALDLNSIPLDNVARIEVQKGVSSVLYGPNGLAGVINIITKKPTSRPSLDARAELGDYESRRFSLSHGMKIAKVNYWLGYEHLRSGGWYLSRDFDPRTTRIKYMGVSHPQLPSGVAVIEDGGVRENSDSKTDALWAKIGVEPTENSEYYVNFHYISRERGGPASQFDDANRVMTTFSQLFRWPRYDNWGIDMSGQQKMNERVTFKGKLFYHDHFDNMDSYTYPDYTGKYATGAYKDNMLGGSLLSDIKLVEADTLRLAYNFRRDEHKERDFAGTHFREAVSYTGSLAIENEFNPLKNFSIVAGLGYDWFNVTKSLYDRKKPYDDHLSPMAGVTYTFEDGTRLFGSWARKIRYPTLTWLYSSSNGNPDLKPEKSDNYVIGASRNITRYARGEISLFYHNAKDFIAKETPDTAGRWINYGKTTICGFEVAAEIFPTKDLSFRLGYTYEDAKDRSPGRLTSRVVGIPEHKIDVTGSYLIPYIGAKLDVIGLYVSDVWGQLPTPTTNGKNAVPLKTSDYFLLDVRIGKKIYTNFEVYFVAKNIFDKDYEQEIGFPGPGRNLFAGIKYSY